MIGVRLQGRLGNQLFQYAFIYSTAKTLGEAFLLDQHIERLIIAEYFVLRPGLSGWLSRRIFSIKGYKNLFSYRLRILIYSHTSMLFKHFVSYPFDISPMEVSLQKNTFYQGYFQSCSFFEPYTSEIKDLFKIKRKYAELYISRFSDILEGHRVVTVHIRRQDYQNFLGNDITLPMEYYHKVLRMINEPNALYILISDEPALVKEEFSYLKNVLISEELEITDFQHLLRADICVIANSTFSWWGAFLNQNPSKKVYAPQHFLGWREQKEIPIDIYPSSWNIVSFLNKTK